MNAALTSATKMHLVKETQRSYVTKMTFKFENKELFMQKNMNKMSISYDDISSVAFPRLKFNF